MAQQKFATVKPVKNIIAFPESNDVCTSLRGTKRRSDLFASMRVKRLLRLARNDVTFKKCYRWLRQVLSTYL